MVILDNFEINSSLFLVYCLNTFTYLPLKGNLSELLFSSVKCFKHKHFVYNMSIFADVIHGLEHVLRCHMIDYVLDKVLYARYMLLVGRRRWF